jgi:phage tail-like protein
MPCRTAEPRPRDPLRNYQFHIYLRGTAGDVPVGGVQRVSGLSAHVSPFEIWEGGNNLHRYAQPDKLTWDAVTLEQGLVLDDTLETWAQGVHHFAMTGELLELPGTGQVAVKRDVIIEICDPVMPVHQGLGPPPPGGADDDPSSPAGSAQSGGPGQVGRPRGRRFHLYNAWISKWNALPRLDALSQEVALLLMELVHEGWQLEPPVA